MTIFEMLNLRYEYEEIIRQYPTDQDSTISGMKAFLQTGVNRNRFRPGFDRAIEIANTILENEKCAIVDTLNTSMMQDLHS